MLVLVLVLVLVLCRLVSSLVGAFVSGNTLHWERSEGGSVKVDIGLGGAEDEAIGSF